MAENVASRPQHPLHQLRVKDLSVQRDGQMILDHVSFNLRCGEIVALIGPNGGGKSTLLKAIVGEIPASGQILFSDTGGNQFAKPRIGYMMQQLDFDRQAPLTVADLLCANQSRWPVFLGQRPKRRAEIQQLLEQVEAGHLIDKQLGTLSGGELQRVLLAFALDPLPDILLLDEPVSAMDKTGKRLFYEMVQHLRDRYDMLTLMVSHDLDVISSFASSVIYLNQRVLSAGPMADVLASDQVQDAFDQ
jgi:zinc transport system ATP-binding protein